MTCKKSYACDLCHDPILDPVNGIGIQWAAGNQIKNVYLTNSEHHLCNRCTEGLREMFKDIDRMVGIHQELDGAEAAERKS